MNDDLERLQGSWNITALEVDGQTMASGVFSGSQIIVDGHRFTSLSMGATYEGVLEVDAAATPKAFNLHFDKGPEQGNTSFGIYELDGDSWKICLTITGANRPQTFATQPKSGLALETLTRNGSGAKTKPASKQTNEPPLDLPIQPVPELEGDWAMVSCIRDGVPLDAALVGCGRRTAKGNLTNVSFGAQLFMEAHYNVDRSKQPHTMDHTHTHGRAQGQHQYGIYRLKGDELTILMSAPGQDRPADFTTSVGDGRTLSVWKLSSGSV